MMAVCNWTFVSPLNCSDSIVGSSLKVQAACRQRFWPVKAGRIDISALRVTVTSYLPRPSFALTGVCYCLTVPDFWILLTGAFGLEVLLLPSRFSAIVLSVDTIFPLSSVQTFVVHVRVSFVLVSKQGPELV